MKTIILCAISGAVAAFVTSEIYEGEGMRSQYDSGFKQGWHDALHKRPVNEELELVCAGLWIGNEAKKYWEKQNEKK
jgi:hypothetical protein